LSNQIDPKIYHIAGDVGGDSDLGTWDLHRGNLENCI
jgi:hypothetical protein